MDATPGRNVFVQGASRGLGLAFVRALLEREGARRIFASARAPEHSPGLAALREQYAERLHLVRLDVRDEASIEAAARRVRETTLKLHLLLNVAGVLHDGEALRPEKKLDDVDPALLRRAFEVNAFGPLLVAKHFASFLRHEARAVLGNVSARVGSIGDNRLGGWYAYRASKAAQNMFTRTLSIELARRAPNVRTSDATSSALPASWRRWDTSGTSAVRAA